MHADGMLRAGPNEQLPWWVHGVKLQPFWRMFVFTFLACITLQWVVQRPVHAVMSTRVCARQGVASSHAGFPVATCLLEPWDGVNHVCSLIHREKQPFPFLSCFFFIVFVFNLILTPLTGWDLVRESFRVICFLCQLLAEWRVSDSSPLSTGEVSRSNEIQFYHMPGT